MSVLAPQIDTLAGIQPMRLTGTVAALRGMTLLVDDLPLPVGSLVRIERIAASPNGDAATPAVGPPPDDHPASGPSALRQSGHLPPLGELVGFTREHAIVMPLGQTAGIRVGDLVVGEQAAQTVNVGDRMLGRVIDGLGRPIDGLGPIPETVARPLNPPPIGALSRRRIAQAMHTGVRAVDLMATLGRGQRIGIFAGPGVGKSVLLGQIARNTDADVNVIALVGERGREVRDFLECSLGPEGLARSVVVVATGDESPLMRIRAAHVACAAAEHFRAAGRDAMLMMDSVTRFAHAQRQVGLSVGEPPATRGYTPSVFAALALLLERAGAVNGGSITGIYTILVEGDDMTEPVADAARGILDGHLILSRRLAHRGHYPAVDVLDSVSRVASDVCDNAHVQARRHISRLLAIYTEMEDMIQIGAYARGSNPEADTAIDFFPRFEELLRQGQDEHEPFERSRERLVKLALESGDVLQRALQRGAGRLSEPSSADPRNSTGRP